MATSGSTDYLDNRNEIITEALELLGVLPAGDTANANDISSCSRTLNMMVKHWQANGIALWKNTQIYIFLEPDAQSYTLGPSGDEATASMAKTEISTAASSGDSTIEVDGITGISNGDNIGVELDGGSLQWTTVNGAPSGTTITLTASLTDDVSVDANVFAYTSGISRPLFLTEIRIHKDSGTEIPVNSVSRNKYMSMSTKDTEGTITQAYYDPQTINGKLYVWPTADSVKDYLVATARMPIDDFDSSTDDPDFPQEWLLPLAYNLAVAVAPKFDEPLTPIFIAQAQKYLQDASDSSVDFNSLQLEFE